MSMITYDSGSHREPPAKTFTPLDTGADRILLRKRRNRKHLTAMWLSEHQITIAAAPSQRDAWSVTLNRVELARAMRGADDVSDWPPAVLPCLQKISQSAPDGVKQTLVRRMLHQKQREYKKTGVSAADYRRTGVIWSVEELVRFADEVSKAIEAFTVSAESGLGMVPQHVKDSQPFLGCLGIVMVRSRSQPETKPFRLTADWQREFGKLEQGELDYPDDTALTLARFKRAMLNSDMRYKLFKHIARSL